MENAVVGCGCKLDVRTQIGLEENCLLTSPGVDIFLSITAVPASRRKLAEVPLG